MLRFVIFFLLFVSVNFLNAFVLSNKTVIVKTQNSLGFSISAKELSNYIKKITKYTPKIVSKISKTNSAIILLKLSKHKLDGGFFIKTKKDKLILASSSDIGLLNATYYFLDHYLGCKFLTKDFQHIPHYKTKVLKDIYDLQIPAFSYREIFISEADDLRFSLQNLLNGRLGHRIEFEKNNPLHQLTINTYSFISSEIIDQRYKCGGQYEYNNKDAQKSALKYLTKSLGILPKDQKVYATLEHEDRGSTCDKNLDHKTPNQVFLDYTTSLANSLKDKFPQVMFFHQAYFWSRGAPKSAKKLPKNLGVLFSPIEADFARPLNSKENQDIYKDLKSWQNLTDNILVWHYFTNFNSYLTPYPDLYAKWYDLKDFKKLGFVKGVFLQGSYGGEGGDLSDLRVWVFSKLLWNPDQDIKKLIKEFCRYYYGSGGKYVELYIETLHSFLYKSKEKLMVKTPIDMRYLSPKNIQKLDDILTTGLKKLDKNSIYYKHYEKLFLGIDLVRILRGDKLKNQQKLRDRIKKILKENPSIKSFSEGMGRDRLLKLIKLDRKTATIPKEVKNSKWLDFQEYQLELCCADIVEDMDASDGISAVMDGKSSQWGFSLSFTNIPDGRWDIYARVKITLKKDTLIDKGRWALKYGIEPDKKRGIKFIAQLPKDRYTTFKIGSYDTKKDSSIKYLWISPPANDIVKKLYLDRIFFIKRN